MPEVYKNFRFACRSTFTIEADDVCFPLQYNPLFNFAAHPNRLVTVLAQNSALNRLGRFDEVPVSVLRFEDNFGEGFCPNGFYHARYAGGAAPGEGDERKEKADTKKRFDLHLGTDFEINVKYIYSVWRLFLA